MLSLALLTPNALAADGIEHLTQESGLFKLVFKGLPMPPIPTIMRALGVHAPELVLLDLGDWDAVSAVVEHIRESNFQGAIIGFRPGWNRLEQLAFEEAGILDLLRDPFSTSDIEAVAYEALHRKRPVRHENILTFLPAKAGGGCSTVVLNTAAALTQGPGKSVLLIESDRRSGALDYAQPAIPEWSGGGPGPRCRNDSGRMAATLYVRVRNGPVVSGSVPPERASFVG